MGILNFLRDHISGGGGGAQQQAPAMIKDRDGNLVPLPAPQSQSGGARQPSQNALRDLPGGWLNVFSAVRGYNQARMQGQELQDREQQQGFENNLSTQQEARTQGTFDQAKALSTTLAGVGAYTNMVDSIDNNSAIAEADRPQAYAAAFDRIAPALQSAGMDPQRLDQVREQLVTDPHSAGDLLAGLEGSVPGGGSQPSLQAAFGPDGEAVFINPRTARPAARGYAPAAAVLGHERVGISQQNADTAGGRLEQQQLSNDPNHAFDVSSAQAEGQVAGQSAAREPEALAAGREVIRRIDTVLNTPPDQLGDVLGMPSLGGALRGGFGQYGAWPGSERANIQSDIGSLSSSLRTAAYQLVLKGGGSITEAESAFAGEAFVNLQRSQSPAQFRENLAHARSYFGGLLSRYSQQASPTRNPNRSDGARGAPAAAPANRQAPAAAPANRQAPAAAPANRQAPAAQGGVNVDDYLAQRGF